MAEYANANLVIFKCLLFFVVWFLVVVVEEFVVHVFAGGKVTVTRRLRVLFEIKDGDYVKLGLVEVLKRDEKGEWLNLLGVLYGGTIFIGIQARLFDLSPMK